MLPDGIGHDKPIGSWPMDFIDYYLSAPASPVGFFVQNKI